MQLDKDLASIQEVRDMMKKAKAARAAIEGYTQSQIDGIVAAAAGDCVENAEPLAKMAVEETGFGVWQDKVLKNLLGSKLLLEAIRDMKTIGILSHDKVNKVMEVAVPVGIVAALVPSTNPTSTTMFKAIISIKAGNAVIFSPHPGALRCILSTVEILRGALRRMGAPEDLVQCVHTPTIAATNELMRHKDTGIILATGGAAMVRAAYSSGKPALGVGAGNGPAFIERTADISAAVRHVIESKTFDNGTICASEQSIVTEKCISGKVLDELRAQGCYILNEDESRRVGSILMRADNSMNPKIVGKTARFVAGMAGVTVPPETKVLVSPQTTVGEYNPYSREKLCPVLGFYAEEGWEEACARCIEILENEGIGHTMVIHSQNEDIIREFALKKPISRLLVNTPAALGGVGATTGLFPSLTLGCGAAGGSATSDNVGPMHLFNIRRVAWGTKELAELRGASVSAPSPEPSGEIRMDSEMIERITQEVINTILQRNNIGGN